MNEKLKTICYFGIYHPTAPRDKVYLDGLKKLGFRVIECVDNSRGFSKFFRLAKKHKELEGSYDVLWVGYLSTMLVPLAWFLTKKKVVFNALDSWYDRSILDREAHSPFSPKAWVIWLCDFFAFYCADSVLVESQQQQLFISKTFFASPSKLKVVFTGVDERVFYPDQSVTKAEDFTVVFRGMFLPATGVEIVIEAAQILKDNAVEFVIIGWGEPIQKKIKSMIAEFDLTNVTLITHFLPTDELRSIMLSAQVMLGQFGDHERLNRTIQNKNFEALALGLPFITRDSVSNRELFIDGENCLFVPPASAEALAEKILTLKNSTTLQKSLSISGRKTFESKCRGELLADEIRIFLS